MNLVDEKHIVRLEVGQYRCEVARLGNHWARRGAKTDTHLPRQYLRQRRLAQSRRAEQQNMVQRLAAPARRVDIDFQVRLGLALPDIVVKRLRPQSAVQRIAALCVRIGQLTLAAHRLSSFSAAFTSGPTSVSPTVCEAAATARAASLWP